MRRAPGPRGFTILENIIALAVLLIASSGLLSLNVYSLRLGADSRRVTRATYIAQDLLNNVELWHYNRFSGPLVDSNAGNDGDIGDTAQAFESDPPPADHGEADIPADYPGIPAAQLQDYQRYWNVAYTADNAAQVAVIVRWPHGGAWRRVVMFALKPDPSAR